MSGSAENDRAADPAARAATRRRLAEAALVVGLFVVGGLVLIVTGLSEGGVAVGSAIMGFGGVAALSAFFYEVGRGEDDDRAAAAGRATPPERRPPDSPRPRRPD